MYVTPYISDEVRDNFQRRVAERDERPVQQFLEDRAFDTIVSWLGRQAMLQPQYEIIRADMLDWIVYAYGGLKGQGFDEQVEFLIGQGVTPFELAFFFWHYDDVVDRLSECYAPDPDGYDFRDKLWDVIRDNDVKQTRYSKGPHAWAPIFSTKTQ